MANKTFDIDLLALNCYLGDNRTEFGYYIDAEEGNWTSDCYYDLRGAAGLYACDGEVCEVVDEYEDVVVVRNTDYNLCGEFKFSKDEFAIVAGIH